MQTIRIGCGAGYAGDRIDSAVDLARYGKLHYLVLECLAERTIALAHLNRKRDAGLGYGQFLEERMTALLPLCKEKGFKIITNLGAANPLAALEKTVEIAEKTGATPLRVAAVLGSDVLEKLPGIDCRIWETGASLSDLQHKAISADAYLGVEEILPALQAGADVIITGRVADPSLFLAPMVYEFSWPLDDWLHLGKGTVLAHLLECASQVSGGYFADPGLKDVPDLANVGFPLAEVEETGDGIITKVDGTGGIVSTLTCKEQLLYEIYDPSCYLTPDVTADFSKVIFKEAAKNRVKVTGGSGSERPPTLKATIGVYDGYLGEAMVSYAGHNAVERAKLARQILEARYARLCLDLKESKFELAGINALHGHIGGQSRLVPYEVILRAAVKSEKIADAQKAVQEVENLWLNGPGGPGGIRKAVNLVLAAYSTTIPRNEIEPQIIFREVI
ncbi:MAG: DUF1446 domain-containing protein [Dethiobacter sp.]|jgi:hypothetical protein|nr:DUF1446 domain-containing protein [Dethiobacter sp.]